MAGSHTFVDDCRSPLRKISCSVFRERVGTVLGPAMSTFAGCFVGYRDEIVLAFPSLASALLLWCKLSFGSNIRIFCTSKYHTYDDLVEWWSDLVCRTCG